MLQELNYPAPTACDSAAGHTDETHLGKLPVSIQCSSFEGANGTREIQWVIRPTQYADFDTQLKWVQLAYEQVVQSEGLSMNSAIWRRFLCSDLLNQKESLAANPISATTQTNTNPTDVCAVSWVGQPPVAPSKVSLWAQHLSDPSGALEKSQHENTVSLHRGELTHHWTTQVTDPDANGSYRQTLGIFQQYEEMLQRNQLSLADHVVRTWFFAQNVDAHYDGLVRARNTVFDRHGLTSESHYIASTGIEGYAPNVNAHTMMDAYAVNGLKPEQICHLHALDYLSPTHIYGVAFERGTAIAYRDRKHVFISGTASINSLGEILHRGDVFKQLDRTLVNIEALLDEAGASWPDMQVMLVYLRDPNDHGPILEVLQKRFPEIPFEVVTAPVCRPGWLIEIEGLAITANDAPELPSF